VLGVDHDKRRLALSLTPSDGATAADVEAVTRAQAATPGKLGTLADLFKKK